MNEPYTPANGSEGADFFDTWCRRCQRDKAMREGADFDECDDNDLCDESEPNYRSFKFRQEKWEAANAALGKGKP